MIEMAFMALTVTAIVGLFAIVFPKTFKRIGDFRHNYKVFGMRIW